MKLLAVLFTVVIATASYADPVILSEKLKVTWQRPTTLMNGDKLLKKEIKNYHLFAVPEEGSGDPEILRIKTVVGSSSKMSIKQPYCSTFWYAMQVELKDGRKSILSDPISYTSICPEQK